MKMTGMLELNTLSETKQMCLNFQHMKFDKIVGRLTEIESEPC